LVVGERERALNQMWSDSKSKRHGKKKEFREGGGKKESEKRGKGLIDREGVVACLSTTKVIVWFQGGGG